MISSPTAYTAVIQLGQPVERSTIQALQAAPCPVPASQLGRAVIITAAGLHMIGYRTTQADSGVLEYSRTPTPEATCASS